VKVEELDVTSRDDFLDPLRGASGLLSRPTDLRRHWSFIERVSLRKENLVWRDGKPRIIGDARIYDGNLSRRAIFIRRQAQHDGRGILDEFIELGEGTNRQILDFARTWGVLELCRHHLPYRHGERPAYVRLPIPAASLRSRAPCEPLGIEPLEVWRFYSRQAKTLLRIAANLERGMAGDAADWSVVLRDRVVPSEGADGICWSDTVESWMQIGDVQLMIDRASRRITWRGADLFGELAVQIALAGMNAPAQAYCTICGKAYAPKKQITRGGVHYCPSPRCQKLATALRAKRYRESRRDPQAKKDARDLRFRGVFGGMTNDPLFS
jgi:hypothetical protein